MQYKNPKGVQMIPHYQIKALHLVLNTNQLKICAYRELPFQAFCRMSQTFQRYSSLKIQMAFLLGFAQSSSLFCGKDVGMSCRVSNSGSTFQLAHHGAVPRWNTVHHLLCTTCMPSPFGLLPKRKTL